MDFGKKLFALAMLSAGLFLMLVIGVVIYVGAESALDWSLSH